MNEADSEIILDIVGCARCDGEGHDQLTFKRLHRPIELGFVSFSHWALCPINNQPILLNIVEE